jgi:predicted Zn-dependent protease
VRMVWAIGLLDTGNLSEARQALMAAKTASPNNVAADEAIARLDFSEGKVDDARHKLAAVLTTDPANVPARILLGTMEVQINNRAAAIEHFRKVVAADSMNVIALNNLAFLLAQDSTQFDQALKYATKQRSCHSWIRTCRIR